MSHFKTTRKGIVVTFTPAEQAFLGDVLPLLAGIGETGIDPAATRLNVPVYLDDQHASDEWWRLMGADLGAARLADRSVFQRVVGEETKTLDEADANAFLRVLNEARLVLGARMGVEVEDDHDNLPDDSRQVLDYLGWVQEELTLELSRSL